MTTIPINPENKPASQEQKEQEDSIIYSKIVSNLEGNYCMVCKVNKPMLNAWKYKLKNGMIVYIGKCETCGTEIYRKEN